LTRRNLLCISQVCIVAIGLLSLVTIGTAEAQLTLYDDFSAKEINGDLWTSQQSGSGGLDLVRQPLSGKLLMSLRVVGDTSTDTGQRTSHNQLRFRNGSGINTIWFNLTVRSFAVLGCEAVGAGSSRSLAGFFSALFNDGSSAGPGDQTGDIGAFIFLQRASDSPDAADLLRLVAGMVRCAGPACSPVEDIGLLDLGTVPQYNTVGLGMVWEAAQKRVLFVKNDEPAQLVSYPQDLVTPRGFRVLEVRGEAASCDLGGSPFAKMTAVFDNVYVNP
jgi:hypothetical protein